MRESWQAARRAEQVVAGRVPLKYMHGHGRAVRDRAVDLGVRDATPGAVLDADLRADRVRVQFDDDEVLDEAIVAIGRTGYLVRERAVHELLDTAANPGDRCRQRRTIAHGARCGRGAARQSNRGRFRSGSLEFEEVRISGEKPGTIQICAACSPRGRRPAPDRRTPRPSTWITGVPTS